MAEGLRAIQELLFDAADKTTNELAPQQKQLAEDLTENEIGGILGGIREKLEGIEMDILTLREKYSERQTVASQGAELGKNVRDKVFDAMGIGVGGDPRYGQDHADLGHHSMVIAVAAAQAQSRISQLDGHVDTLQESVQKTTSSLSELEAAGGYAATAVKEGAAEIKTGGAVIKRVADGLIK